MQVVLVTVLVFAVVSLTVLSSPTPSNSTDVCWKGTTTRGVGHPISCCPSSHPDKDASLCYVTCKSNYTGVGPVCWENCPPGWIDEGALCRLKGSIKTIAKKSYGRGVGIPLTCCPNQEYDAGLCYPPCPSLPHAPGVPMHGVGPVCWQQCEAPDPVDGGAICAFSHANVTKKILELSLGVPLAVMDAILHGDDPAAIVDDVKHLLDAILGFVMPLCYQLA